MVKKVDRWEVGGKEFDSKAEAVQHEKDLELATKIAIAARAKEVAINGDEALHIATALRTDYNIYSKRKDSEG